MQLIRLTKSNDGGEIWVNTDLIIYAEPAEKKVDKAKITIVHMSGKEKLFVKENPAEINKISRSIKKEIKIEM